MDDRLARPSLRALWRASHASSAVAAGVIAAIPGALLAVGVIVAADLLAGRPAADTLVLIGRMVSPADASWAQARAAGVLVHAGVAVIWGGAWGVLVAFTAHHLPPLAGALWGAVFGLAIWLVGFMLVLPWLDPILAARTRLALLWHLVFGATTGALFHVARLRERERHLQRRT